MLPRWQLPRSKKVHSTVDDFKAWVEQVEAALKVEEAQLTDKPLFAVSVLDRYAKSKVRVMWLETW